MKSDFVEAHYNLGNTLQELGRLDEAEASYNQAIALKPDYAEAHSNLGSTLKKLDRLDEAEASYTQAIILKNNFGKAQAGLGQVLMLKGQHKEGLRQIRLGNGSIVFDINNWAIIQ